MKSSIELSVMKTPSNNLSSIILSIVTVTKNDKLGFANTSRSVEKFIGTSKEIEWIVINAGEKNLSIPSAIHNQTSINEKDNGPFFGMNKGLEKAQGKYVNFMNSGDSIVTSVSSAELVALLNKSDFTWAVANAQKESSRSIEHWKIPKRILFKFWFGLNSFPHQSTFYNRDSITHQGGFNASNIAADYEISLKMFKDEKPKRIHFQYSLNSAGGISDNLKLMDKIKAISISHQQVFPFVKKFWVVDFICIYLLAKISVITRKH